MTSYTSKQYKQKQNKKNQKKKISKKKKKLFLTIKILGTGRGLQPEMLASLEIALGEKQRS